MIKTYFSCDEPWTVAVIKTDCSCDGQTVAVIKTDCSCDEPGTVAVIKTD